MAWDLLSRPLDPQPSGPDSNRSTKAQLTLLVQGDVATLRICGAISFAHSGRRNDRSIALWEAPRSLLLEAVTTLVRRLFRQWRLAFPGDGRRTRPPDRFHPLPDFVPRNLFSDLSLPEVRVISPATVNHEERTETMPVLQALNQLVPGRVTRRFAHERGALSHWVPVDRAFPEQDLRISDYAEENEFVVFTGRFNDATTLVRLSCSGPGPCESAEVARMEALPSSNARLTWHTDIVTNGDRLPCRSPSIGVARPH